MTDPMFRQRLRNHHRDLIEKMRSVEVGSRAYFKLDAAMRSNEALHLELFREPFQKVHCQPPYREKP
jgi:hypothetical protein